MCVCVCECVCVCACARVSVCMCVCERERNVRVIIVPISKGDSVSIELCGVDTWCHYSEAVMDRTSLYSCYECMELKT